MTWPVNPFVRMSPFERVVDGVGLIGRYLWRGIMPGPMSIDYAFASPGLGKDEQWSHTFDEPGEYGYAIKEHPSAKGRIVVE